MQQNTINAADVVGHVDATELKVGSINFAPTQPSALSVAPNTAIDLKAIQATMPRGIPELPAFPGYRILSQAEKDLINKIKATGDQLHALLNEVRDLHMADITRLRSGLDDHTTMKELNRLVEQGTHWRGRAADDLQDGIMKLVRAVARPTTFA